MELVCILVERTEAVGCFGAWCPVNYSVGRLGRWDESTRGHVNGWMEASMVDRHQDHQGPTAAPSTVS